MVFVEALRKVFNSTTCFKKSKETKVAVDNLSFIVPPGEIFGLLGPNGAGKTTTIKILVADEYRTQVKVVLVGQEVVSALSPVFDDIGYCPQHDTLWPELTLQEHLLLFAAIRGISDGMGLSKTLMQALQIEEHKDKKVMLSGGTKRKTCFAIALIGQPRLLFLDEPSTGMDPQAKNFFGRRFLPFSSAISSAQLFSQRTPWKKWMRFALGPELW